MTTQDERTLLWAAVEDDAGLWEAEWELRPLHRDWAAAALRSRARDILVRFLDDGLVVLYRCQEPYGALTRLPLVEARAALQDDRWWDPPAVDGHSVRFGATKDGERLYESIP